MKYLVAACIVLTGCGRNLCGAPVRDATGAAYCAEETLRMSLHTITLRSDVMNLYLAQEMRRVFGVSYAETFRCLGDSDIYVYAGDMRQCTEERYRDRMCYGTNTRYTATGISQIWVTERECWYDSAYVHEQAHTLQHCFKTTDIDKDLHEDVAFFAEGGIVEKWDSITRAEGWCAQHATELDNEGRM